MRVAFFKALMLVASVHAVRLNDDAADAKKVHEPCPCQPDPTPAADALAILGADPENHNTKWHVTPAKTGPTTVQLNAQVECEEEKKDEEKKVHEPCPCQPDPTPAKDALEILGADPENHNTKWHVTPAKTGPTLVTLNQAQIEGEEEKKDAEEKKVHEPCKCQPDPTPAKDALEILGADPENHNTKWHTTPAKTGPTLVKLNSMAEVDAEDDMDEFDDALF